MKKIVTTMALATIMFACNNSADSSSSTTATPGADTIQTDTLPPPPPPIKLDTPASQSDSAKVKKAMRK